MNITSRNVIRFMQSEDKTQLCLWTQVLPWAFTVGAIAAAVAVVWYITHY